jgi:hypothetical protein
MAWNTPYRYRAAEFKWEGQKLGGLISGKRNGFKGDENSRFVGKALKCRGWTDAHVPDFLEDLMEDLTDGAE